MGIDFIQYIQLIIVAALSFGLFVAYDHSEYNMVNKRIDGLLYPAVFSFLFVLFYFYYSSYNLFNMIFVSEISRNLFNQNSAEYNAFLTTFLKTELAINVFFAIGITYMAGAFMARKQIFPKFYVRLNLLALGYLIGMQTCWLFIPDHGELNVLASYQIALVAFGAQFWLPQAIKYKRSYAAKANNS